MEIIHEIKRGPIYKLYDMNNQFLFETKNKKLLSKHTGFIEGHNSKWCTNKGIPHRVDGPAFEYFDGKKEKYYYIFGKPCLKEQHTLLVDIMKLKGLL